MRFLGPGRVVSANKNEGPWRQMVTWEAAKALDDADAEAFEGPLKVAASFVLPRPKSAMKRIWPFKKPDLDKLLRSVFDALTDAGVWLDDAQVVKVIAEKRYAESNQRTGALLSISRVSEDERLADLALLNEKDEESA